MSVGEVLDPVVWERGQSRRRSFPSLSPGQVSELLYVLPADLGPYELFASTMVGQGREFRSVMTRIDAADVPALRAQGVSNFFIASRSLSASMLDALEACSQATFAINGAVLVQVGTGGKLGIDLALTLTAVQDDDHWVRHDEYERVFRSAVGKARRLSA